MSKLRQQALLIGALALTSFLPALAQTEEEVRKVSAILGSPQTKSTTNAYFSGYYFSFGDFEKSRSYMTQMAEICEKDPAFGLKSAKYAWTLAKIGACDEALGKHDKALDLSKKARDILNDTTRAEQAGDDVFRKEALIACERIEKKEFVFPSQISREDRMNMLAKRATAARFSGAPAEACLMLEDALIIARELKQPKREMQMLNNLAGCEKEVHEYADAEQSYRKALALWSTDVGDSLTKATILDNLALTLAEQKKYETAIECENEALPTFRAAAKANNGKIKDLIVCLSNSCRINARAAKNEAAGQQATEIEEALTKLPNDKTSKMFESQVDSDIAAWLSQAGSMDRAEKLGAQSVKLAEEQLGPDSAGLLAFIAVHGMIAKKAKDYPVAEKCFDRGIKLATSANESTMLRVLYPSYVEVLQAEGKSEAAQKAQDSLNLLNKAQQAEN